MNSKIKPRLALGLQSTWRRPTRPWSWTPPRVSGTTSSGCACAPPVRGRWAWVRTTFHPPLWRTPCCARLTPSERPPRLCSPWRRLTSPVRGKMPACVSSSSGQVQIPQLMCACAHPHIIINKHLFCFREAAELFPLSAYVFFHSGHLYKRLSRGKVDSRKIVFCFKMAIHLAQGSWMKANLDWGGYCMKNGRQMEGVYHLIKAGVSPCDIFHGDYDLD